MKILVSGLSEEANTTDVRALFAQHGDVKDVTVFMPRVQRQDGRWSAFVEMADRSAAMQAIDRLQDIEYKGAIINLSQCRPLTP